MKCNCKNLKEIRIKFIVQLWKHYYRSSKPEAGQTRATRWIFSFINANWWTLPCT